MNRSVVPADLPTVGQLHRAVVGAVVLAAVLTVTAVLPAELGIDPTGIGSMVGLTAMGELKQGPPAEPGQPVFESRNHAITLTLEPGEGTEVKAVMRKGDALTYTWSTDGSAVFFDFHGEPDGAAADVFTSFEKGSRVSSEGAFEAPFTGVHGWYWKNRGTTPVELVLETRGVYASIRHLQ